MSGQVKRELLAEFLGTAMLLIGVVGSGIMGENLAGGNVAIVLLANAIATGAMLYVLIHIFGKISGAHFNPAVTLYFRLVRQLDNKKMLGYWLAQVAGGVLGVWFTHLMFDQRILQISTNAREGWSLFASEIFATFGLILTIVAFIKHSAQFVPAGVALFITGAYWFTSSTSFANPAVTIARGFTNTFTGIAPAGIAMFILAQFIGVMIIKFVWDFLSKSSEV